MRMTTAAALSPHFTHGRGCLQDMGLVWGGTGGSDQGPWHREWEWDWEWDWERGGDRDRDWEWVWDWDWDWEWDRDWE